MDSRPCKQCGEMFTPRHSARELCSERCRNRRKYLAMKNDPEAWGAYLARMRRYYAAQHPPAPKAPSRLCSVEGCERVHQARGFCSMHYKRDRYRRGLDHGRGRHMTFVGALVKRYDETGFVTDPQPRRLVADVTPGLLWTLCPECGHIMRSIQNALGLDLRDCNVCGVRASLNREEVEWLIYERRMEVA